MSGLPLIFFAVLAYVVMYLFLHILCAFTVSFVEVIRISRVYEVKLVRMRNALSLQAQQHASEVQALYASHKLELERMRSLVANQVQAARADSVKRSRATIRGQATEHLAPLLMEGFNPKDVRWVGLPLDFVVFHGLSDVIDGVGNSIAIYLVDVKTSKSQLSKVQRRIRDAVMTGQVVFGVFNPDSREFKEYRYAESGADGVPVQVVPVAYEATRETPCVEPHEVQGEIEPMAVSIF